MKKVIFVLIIFIIGNCLYSSAQKLKPGFEKQEYIELLKLTAKHTNPDYFKDIPAPEHFKMQYRAVVSGLDNAWELWTDNNGAAAISIRGTTGKPVSWLENFYAAMVPAQGTIKLSSSSAFQYKLADNPGAAVHAGWLLALASMAPDIVRHIDSCYKAGIKNIYLVGHSQGGGITYLLTAYLYQLQKQKLLPSDIRFKTYCSAGPKPGNLFFAYDYEAMTQEGWAFNVVNTSDWVPEVPLSVQTSGDFNEINPFRDAKKAINKLGFPKNVALRYAYNRMDKPSRRAQRNYKKYLGNMMSKMVRKNMTGCEKPTFYNSSNYVRTGHYIVLVGDDAYFKKYSDDKMKIFQHHMPNVYYYLAMSYLK